MSSTCECISTESGFQQSSPTLTARIALYTPFDRSWTENKDNKLLFLRQLGEWYVTDKCIDKPASSILGGRTSSEAAPLVQPCCAMVPIFSCHFRDKASLHPCKSSNPIDEDGESFW